MRRKFRITYDSDREAAFLVHTPAKIIKFAETPEGIYAIDMDQKKKNEIENKENDMKENTCNIMTIKNNMQYFSKREIMQAKKAREILFALGLPTYKDLKNLIKIHFEQSPTQSFWFISSTSILKNFTSVK